MTASFTEYPPDWTRDDWLVWRRLGIGGSDVAAICGLSTFGSPTSVYYDKTGDLPEQPENESMRWGRLLERPIAEEFTARTDLYVAYPQALVYDVEHPWRRATLDGLVVEGFEPDENTPLGTIEIKTTRDGVFTEEHGGIPDRIALQCQWELGVTTLDRCWLAVLHGGQRLEIYEIAFDELVFKRLCTIADRFWQQHVLAENPPPADSNPATTEALKAAFGDRADGTVITLDDDIVLAAQTWLHAKAGLKLAEQQCELYENELRAALGTAEYGADSEGVQLVSWKAQRLAGRLDEKTLRDEEPDVYSRYKKPDGVTRVLRPTKALKASVEVDA